MTDDAVGPVAGASSPDPGHRPPATTAEGGAPRRGGRRSAYATRDLTTGSIPRNLVFLAWPQMIEASLRVVDQLADLVWAGFIGSRAIAGMGAAQQYVQLAFTARLGMDIGTRAMVARAVGMGNMPLAHQAVYQAATLTLGYSILMILIGLFLTESLLRIVGVSEAVIAQGAPYMRIQLMGQSVLGFQMLFAHVLGAAGDTLTPMKAAVVARVGHLVLSPLLVFGVGFLPEFGLQGAAMANVIAQSAALVLLLIVLFRGTSRLHLSLRDYRLDWPLLRQMVKIGTPASINGMERSFAQLILLGLVAPFGDFAVAAFAVTRRVEMFAHMGSQGFGMASGVIVGQSLGAGRPERAKSTVMWSAGYVAVANGVLTVLILAFPVAFLSLFNREPEFLEVARTWLVIAALGYMAFGIGQVMVQSFQGAGDTLAVMLGTLGAMWLVELPLAWFLSGEGGLGQFGIAWAMLSSMLIRPALFVPYFFWGRWMRVRVFAEPRARKAGGP